MQPRSADLDTIIYIYLLSEKDSLISDLINQLSGELRQMKGAASSICHPAESGPQFTVSEMLQ